MALLVVVIKSARNACAVAQWLDSTSSPLRPALPSSSPNCWLLGSASLLQAMPSTFKLRLSGKTKSQVPATSMRSRTAPALAKQLTTVPAGMFIARRWFPSLSKPFTQTTSRSTLPTTGVLMWLEFTLLTSTHGMNRDGGHQASGAGRGVGACVGDGVGVGVSFTWA